MGHKIFISYKYGDTSVRKIEGINETKVRDYVDIIQDKIGKDNINKGEKDGEDLSNFKEKTIKSKLRDKIYDSSVTIVLISKNMIDYTLPEKDQWIPWEISYSLTEHTRKDKTSKTNAVLAVVIPDEYDSYEFFIKNNTCDNCSCRTLYTSNLFGILENNMFNKIEKEQSECSIYTTYSGYPSYIESVKWDDFIDKYNDYLDIAVDINTKIDEYTLHKLND